MANTPSSEQIAAFWCWFEANQSRYFSFDPTDEPVREALFDELIKALSQIDADLAFEFGPVLGGVRELVITACGIKSAFPAVAAVVSAAPKLAGWRFTAFRPRREEAVSINIGEIILAPENVIVQLFSDNQKVGLVLHLPGMTPEEDHIFREATYLLLDHCLGEYDVETKVSFIEIGPLEEVPEGSVLMSELAARFDQFHAKLNPPATAH